LTAAISPAVRKLQNMSIRVPTEMFKRKVAALFADD